MWFRKKTLLIEVYVSKTFLLILSKIIRFLHEIVAKILKLYRF